MTLRIIAGAYKGRLLKTPKGPSTRPTQGMLREAVFNICQSEIEGARFLDLFAGSGAMAFEALSRGASHATLVEENRNAIACIKENLSLLKAEGRAALLPVKAARALQILSKDRFTIVYIDPPYGTPTDPLLDAILPLLSPNALVFLEERYIPKSQKRPYEPPSLALQSSRHFGDALLHEYRFSGT